MGKDTKADDWRFAGVLSLGASIGLAGGGWVFSFKSNKACHQEDFVLLAAGFGTPGISVDVSLPDFNTNDLGWTPIRCARPFSASDLHGAVGDVLSVGAAIGVGYSRIIIAAKLPNKWIPGENSYAGKLPNKSVSNSSPLAALSNSNNSSGMLSNGFNNSLLKSTGAGTKGPTSTLMVKPAFPTGRMTPVPNKSTAGGNTAGHWEKGVLFRNQTNDGYCGVGEIKNSAQSIGDGLLEAAGKPGKKFRPAATLGAAAVAGFWFGIGNVVLSEVVKATTYVAVSVLSGGLVQAGEALLSGRGLAVLYKFASGYATRLADLTSNSPDLSNSTFNTLKYLDWKTVLKEQGDHYINNRSRLSTELNAVEQAGEAAILQSVLRFGETRGEDAWYDVKSKHRTQLGESKTARYDYYWRTLKRQIDQKLSVGLSPDNSFLP